MTVSTADDGLYEKVANELNNRVVDKADRRHFPGQHMFAALLLALVGWRLFVRWIDDLCGGDALNRDHRAQQENDAHV